MSTKTAFKRVALVAAAALAIGGISAVSANAAASDTFAGTGITTGTAPTVSQTVGTYLSITLAFTGDSNNADNITSSGVGQINVPSIPAGSVTLATSGVTTESATAFNSLNSPAVPGSGTGQLSAVGPLLFSAYSATAGTQVISVPGSGGTSTLTITWGAAPVVSAQYSLINEQPGATGSTLTGLAFTTAGLSNVNGSDTVVGVPPAVATIGVETLSSATAAMNTDTVTATVTGPAILGSSTSVGGGLRIGTGISQAETAGVSYFSVYANGTGGVATITFTDGTTVLGSRTVTFTGAAAKATITQNLFIAPSGAILGETPTGVAQTGTTVGTIAALDVNVVDANGNAVNSLPVLTTSAGTILTVGTCVQVTATPGLYECPVSGAAAAASGSKATVTATVLNTTTSAYDIVSAPVTFTIGGAIAKEVLSTDATSYNALAPVVLTLTATDSAGNAAYDQTVAAGLTSTLVSTTQLGGTAFTPASFTNLINGTAKFSGVYSPAVAGDFTVSGTDAVSTALEAISVTATSAGGSADATAQAAVDAANEATDAANAATDAANAAADSADAATQAAQDAGAQATAALAATVVLTQQVAKIFVKMSKLSALLVRIIKKVHA